MSEQAKIDPDAFDRWLTDQDRYWGNEETDESDYEPSPAPNTSKTGGV